MALNSSPNKIKKSTYSANATQIKKEFKQEDASLISDLDKISSKPASSIAAPRPNFGTLLNSAFHSELVEYPNAIRTKFSKKHLNNRYDCGVCEQNLLTKEKLKMHIIECHAIAKNYKCEICSKRFRLKNSLNQHSITHTGMKPFKCTSCGRQFTQKSSLNTHVKQFHDSNVKMFECNDCSKKFKLKYFLDVHNLTHNGLKPYKCNICDSKFTQKSSLNTHVKQFHESSVPMFQCMRCDKKFLRETMLDKHIENHP